MSREKGEKTYQDLKSLTGLLEQAVETKPAYEQAMQKFLDTLKKEYPGKFETVRFEPGPLKKLDRIEDKIQSEYGGKPERIRDIVRGTFVSDNADDLPRLQDALEKHFDALYVKDNISVPTETGMRNYNNNIRMPNGHIVETQIMHEETWAAKNQSHLLMEQSQALKRQKDISPADEIQIHSIDKENRILGNAAVHDTGLNDHLSPAMDTKQRAKFVIPFDVQKKFDGAAGPLSSVGYYFNKFAAPTVKVGGKIIGALPVVGVVVGVGVNTAEAAELQTTLQKAIDSGEISKEALLEYDTILAGHIAQGGDPSVVLGEAGVQVAFNAWADRHNIGDGQLRDSLQPSSLALMTKNGALYLADAALDVASFAFNKAGTGIGNGAKLFVNAVDHTVDSLTGDLAQRQSIFDALPVLNEKNDASPIHENPAAHNLALIKTQIVWTEEKLEAIETEVETPISPLNRAESIDFLQERITSLNKSFEESYDASKQDGTLNSIVSVIGQQKQWDTNLSSLANNGEIHPEQNSDTNASISNRMVSMVTH